MSKEALGSYCPRCGKDVSRDIIRCSNCGTPILLAPPRTGMLLASGVLSIIAAGLFLLAGIISLFGFLQMLEQTSVITPGIYNPPSPQIEELGILGVLNLLSFGWSVTGGVLTLDRKHVMWVFRVFVFAIVGPIIPFGASFTTPQPFFGVNQIVLFFVFFSLPAICLDVVSLIFVTLRREDFSKS